MNRNQLIFLLLGAALLFALFPGSRDLWNPNEPIYGQAVREMIEGDTWVTPGRRPLPLVLLAAILTAALRA